MKPLPILLVFALAATPAYAGEIYQDFRDKDVDVRLFSRTGDMAGERIRTEPTGLRITMTADPVPKTLGLNTRAPTKGDFEITVGYELLQRELPKTGNGFGLEIYVNTNTPTKEALGFYHVFKVKQGEVYVCDKKTTNKEGQRIPTREYIPADAKSGRLRLVRKGSEVFYLAAVGEAKDFKELWKCEWGAMDVNGIAVRAWGSDHVVDLRITDIRIRDEIAPAATKDVKEQPLPLAVEVQQPATSSWLLWVIGGLASVLVLGLGLLVIVVLIFKGRRSEVKATPNETIAFHCSGCGKSLKTKAGSVGKTVKCPGCGMQTAVPANHGTKQRAGK